MIIFFLLVFIVVGIVIYRSYTNSQSSHNDYSYNNRPNAYTYETEVRPEPKSRPKISAELNDELYSEVRTYCSNHSMTVSDLIRKSVKAYIDSN